MRHHRKGTTSFGRLAGPKKALMNNLVKALLQNERIETTLVRAKETGRLAEKLITYGKKDTVHSRRQAYKILKNRDLVKRLFDEIAPKYKNRNGGYTRVIKTGFRIGDAAPTAIVEFVEEEIAKKKKKQVKTESTKTKKPTTKKQKKEKVEVVKDKVETKEVKQETPETVEPEIEEKQEDLEEAKEEVEEALNEEVTEETPAEEIVETVEEKAEEEKKDDPAPEKETEAPKEENAEEQVDNEKSK